MPKPLRLRISKKTKVLTKKQILHKYRSDWITVDKVMRAEFKSLMKIFDEGGKMETDADFARWVYNKHGAGIYYVQAWKYGRQGFITFMKIEINDEGMFTRLKRSKSALKKEYDDDLLRLRKLKDNLRNAETIEDRDIIKDEISNQKEILDMTGVDYSEEKESQRKNGPYPYLKSIQPVYSTHGFNNYSEESKEKEEVNNSFW